MPRAPAKGMLMLLVLVGLGCQSQTQSHAYPKPEDTTKRELSIEQQKLKHELFDVIRRRPPHGISINKRLKGESESDYREFLALADETRNDGQGEWYYFVFTTGPISDLAELKEGSSFLSINVRDSKIAYVDYAVMHP